MRDNALAVYFKYNTICLIVMILIDFIFFIIDSGILFYILYLEVAEKAK